MSDPKQPKFVCEPEQQKLFDLIADFAVQTVLGWVSNAYKTLTPEIIKSSYLSILLSRFAEEYFNSCATWVYDRSDDYINTKFDEMLAIEIPEHVRLHRKAYDPMDILNIIVPMSMQLLAKMNIKDVIGTDYDLTMKAVDIHLRSITRQYNYIAEGFRGCDCVDGHAPPKEGDKVFNITLRRAIMGPDGEVEIKDDWFEEV